MKLVLAWITALALAVLTAGSCSINHRSGEFQCESQADCSAGRTCSNGYCLGADEPPIDARKPTNDATPQPDAPPEEVCPPQCTSCSIADKACTIDCAQTSCTGTSVIVCPAGWDCDIKCSTPNACRNGINCLDAASCDIECTGAQSCRTLVCGEGRCDIDCQGTSSCRGINCSSSCACDVSCSNQSACDQVSCSDFTCRAFGGGCSSQRFGCDTCE